MYFCPSQRLKILLMTMSMVVIFMPTFSFAASTLVIDEFRISNFDATGKVETHDEYVVVANYGTKPVALSGYRLLKRAKTDTEYRLVDNFGDVTLQPGGRLVAVHGEFVGARDYVFPTNSTSNTLSDSNSVRLVAPDKAVVDEVGWGDAASFETTPLVAPGTGEVYVRQSGVDTDNNANDFYLRTVPVSVDPNATRVVISELLPNPATGAEWFELYNPTNLAISLANLKACDVLGATHCYYFDKSSVLGAGSFAIFDQTVTKITLNNDGDWLELYDVNDNFLTDSGGNYGAADKGVSLAVFGTDYSWTATLTPGATNIYTDIIEVEAEPSVKAKSTTSKVVAKKKTVVMASTSSEESPELVDAETAVKASKTEAAMASVQKALVDKKTLGWALIGLAIMLVVGYTLWYFRDYAKEIYHKIRPGDDSARF